ncbi:MAG: carboxypeptidase-like regulatory domain-containing protein [Candidatus Latescibacter sp.]|nr:carboxypeptidase-like regulatory domain-containing protein [Candidatus Latescibacter sp.]
MSRLIMFVCVICVICSGCSKKSDTTGPGDTDNTGEWKLGHVTTQTVSATPGSALKDSSTGLVFQFPDGGSGTLETAAITSSVNAPVPGKGYYVNYSQEKKINLVFTPKETETVLVYGYGTSNALMTDYTNRYNTWVSIAPTKNTDGSLSFELLMPVAVQTNKSSGVSAKGYQGFKHYFVGLITKDMPEFDKLTAYQSEARKMINSYIDNLPDSRKADARAKVDGDMQWYLSFGSDAYDAFWAYGYFTSVNRYNITINKSYTDPKEIAGHIAHETGHYMFHVLAGNSAYLTAYSQMPYDTSQHGTGDVNDRKKMFIEEPAYFSQYFQTGSAGGFDPTEPRLLLYGKVLSKYDVPSIEGFGCVMLAQLHRTSDTVADVYAAEKSALKRTVPVIGAPFSESFQILAKQPTDIDMLRDKIETYLMTAGKGDLFQPLMQGIGWGYMVSGKLVDKDGNPVSGATVKSVHKSASREWIGSVSTASSGTDGSFSLPSGVFGGRSYVRVIKGTDSTDVDITIDWKQATNVKKDVGTLTVDFSPSVLDQLRKTNYVGAGLSVWNVTKEEPNGDYQWIGDAVYNLKWNGLSFSGAHDDTYMSKHNEVSGTVSADGKTIETISFSSTQKNPKTGYILLSSKMTATNIPMVKINYQWPTVSFKLTSDVKAHVSQYEYFWRRDDGVMIEYLGTINWNHEKTYISVVFNLGDNPFR